MYAALFSYRQIQYLLSKGKKIMEIEKLKKTANKLMWFGLLTQWILLFSPITRRVGMGIGMGLILLVLPLLILSVILSLVLFLYISYEERSFKNTWGQLLVMSLWLGYQALLYTQAIG